MDDLMRGDPALEAFRNCFDLYARLPGIDPNNGFLQIKEVLDGSWLQP